MAPSNESGFRCIRCFVPLDIDGIFTIWVYEKETYSDLKPDLVKLLVRILSTCPSLRIVIHSDWRKVLSREQIQVKFQSIGVEASKIIDMAPIIPPRKHAHGVSFPTRGEALRKWLAQNAPVARWAILDDAPDDQFEGLEEHLFPVDDRVGLSNETYQQVIRFFTRP